MIPAPLSCNQETYPPESSFPINTIPTDQHSQGHRSVIPQSLPFLSFSLCRVEPCTLESQELAVVRAWRSRGRGQASALAVVWFMLCPWKTVLFLSMGPVSVAARHPSSFGPSDKEWWWLPLQLHTVPWPSLSPLKLFLFPVKFPELNAWPGVCFLSH